MPDLGFMLAAVIISGVITVLLRALPFAVLKPLRKSKLVQRLGEWMPVGIVMILAIVVLAGEVAARPERAWVVAVATAVTVTVHLFLGRRALLSIFAGTGVYIALLNLF